MEWLQNLSSAIDYIESNLDSDISYDELAKKACCSTYYFQRMFSYIAGIPLSEYIRRRRMTQAAFELQRTEQKVLDTALKYGYSSPTAFNRAFQSVHGIAPVLAKSPGAKLNAYPAIKLSVQITGGSAMSYHIENKEALRIAGVRIPITEEMEESQRIIPDFWKRTMESEEFTNICRMSDRAPQGILGASVFVNKDQIFYYIAAATDQDVPEHMHVHEIPAATWVIFENDGGFKEDVQSVFRRFFTEWLPFSGYEYAGLPDIEVYPVSEGHPARGHSEVWIAVRERKTY